MHEMMLIVNPASANGRTGKHWPELQARLVAEGLAFDWQFTSGPRHATELARQAIGKGYRTIVSVGGDGTTNEIVNGFFTPDGAPLNPDVTLGILPQGTGGDLGRYLKLRKGTDDAIRRLIAGVSRQIDLGRVTLTVGGQRQSRMYINIADVGLGGDTCNRVNTTTKAFGGFISFLWAMLATVATYRNKQMTVSVDGRQIMSGKSMTTVVANGQFFGGGMHIAPEAQLDDGLFDVVVVADLSKPELIANLSRLYNGTILTHPKVSLVRGRHVAIHCPDAVVEVDGEYGGTADAEFDLVPRALRFLG